MTINANASTVEFQGLDFTKDMIDQLDAGKLKELKEENYNQFVSARIGFIGSAATTATVIGLGMACNTVAANADQGMLAGAFATLAALGAAASAILYVSKEDHKRQAQELDVLELIKTNSPSNTYFRETTQKASASGMFMNKGCIC